MEGLVSTSSGADVHESCKILVFLRCDYKAIHLVIVSGIVRPMVENRTKWWLKWQ